MTEETSERKDFPIRKFSLAFACAVTEESDGAFDLIAKNGGKSLFAVMGSMFPQVRIMRKFPQEISVNYSHSQSHIFEWDIPTIKL